MPELPEVETIANGVHARVQGRCITGVWTSGRPQTFKSPESLIRDTLTGARIDSVRRVGKTIVMTVDATPGRTTTDTPRQAEFLIHLGMTGRLLVSQREVPIPLHTHAVLTLSAAPGQTAHELRFVDPRRFGRLSIHTPTSPSSTRATTHPVRETSEPSQTCRHPGTYTGPGREPLTISAEDFIGLFRRRRTPIKAALLNQSLLHGVGNIYADESLFRAGIRPSRQAARLTRAQLTRLRSALIEVLHQAISLGGSSVSDYVDADGVRGFFQLEHRVYGRTAQACLTCTTPIRRMVIGGRSTHFCPSCQR